MMYIVRRYFMSGMVCDNRVELDLESFHDFLFGGDAEFSIINTERGRKADYHVRVNTEGNVWFIYICEKGNRYRYAGFIVRRGNDFEYRKGLKGTYEYEDACIRVLFYILKYKSRSDKNLQVIHHGKCSVCGRKLKDIESVRRGIGSSCFKKIRG